MEDWEIAKKLMLDKRFEFIYNEYLALISLSRQLKKYRSHDFSSTSKKELLLIFRLSERVLSHIMISAFKNYNLKYNTETTQIVYDRIAAEFRRRNNENKKLSKKEMRQEKYRLTAGKKSRRKTFK